MSKKEHKNEVEAQYQIYCSKTRDCCENNAQCQATIKYYPSMDKTLIECGC